MALVEAAAHGPWLGGWPCAVELPWSRGGWNEGRLCLQAETDMNRRPGLGRSPFVPSRMKISEEVLAPGSSSPFCNVNVEIFKLAF